MPFLSRSPSLQLEEEVVEGVVWWSVAVIVAEVVVEVVVVGWRKEERLTYSEGMVLMVMGAGLVGLEE